MSTVLMKKWLEQRREPLFQQATLNIITLTLQHDDKLSYVIWNKISNINLTFSESTLNTII